MSNKDHYFELPNRNVKWDSNECQKRLDALLAAWEARNLDNFVTNLSNCVSYDFETIHVKSTRNLRIIDTLAGEIGSEKFVEAYINNIRLLNQTSETYHYTADQDQILQSPVESSLNLKNETSGRGAIHSAVSVGNSTVVKILLEAGADVNLQNFNDDTALHILIQRWDLEDQRFMDCLQLLLASPNISLNIPNSRGYTPIHLAAELGEGETLSREILIKSEGLDLDTFRCTEDNTTAREVLLFKFPHLEPILPALWTPNTKDIRDYHYRLFYFLISSQYESSFCQLIQEVMDDREIQWSKPIFSCIDGQGFTYMHKACKRGHLKAVKTLIDMKFDVNNSSSNTHIDSPIVLAAKHGHPEIVSLLLKSNGIDLGPNPAGEPLLHSLVQSRLYSAGSVESLRRLASHSVIDINGRNLQGQTALHYAVKNSNEPYIFTILDHGGKLDIANNFKETPLDLLPKSTLRTFLDSKITTNGFPGKECEFSIKIQYSFVRSQTEFFSFNTSLLTTISKSTELRGLLAHPVFSAAILFKWHRIRKLFYFSLFLYSIFCILTTIYIIFSRDIIGNSNGNCSGLNFTKDLTNSSDILHCSITYSYYHTSITLIIFVYLIFFAATEVTQFFAAPFRYICHLENWLQIAVIIFTAATTASDCAFAFQSEQYCVQLSAITILLIWLEHFFVIGNHPNLIFFIDMFRTASLFLFQFIAVHTAIILGFALSFHVIFRNEQQFSNIAKSLFKTLIMMTGEFEGGNIPFDKSALASHIVFVVFLFLIAIVLFNLLIGLAVSATRPIEDDAFLYRCISQVTIISFFEDVYLNDSHVLNKLYRKLASLFIGNKATVTDAKSSLVFNVFPNKRNKMQVCFISTDNRLKYERNLHLSEKIVNDLQIIIANKTDTRSTRYDNIEELKEVLERVHTKMEGELFIVKTALVEIMEKLKSDSVGGAPGKNKIKGRGMLLKKIKSPFT